MRRLSKSLARDYSNVHSDCKALEAAGLIERDEARRLCVPWDVIFTELVLDEAG